MYQTLHRVNVRQHTRNLRARKPKQSTTARRQSKKLPKNRDGFYLTILLLDSSKVDQLVISDKLLDFVACLPWASVTVNISYSLSRMQSMLYHKIHSIHAAQ